MTVKGGKAKALPATQDMSKILVTAMELLENQFQQAANRLLVDGAEEAGVDLKEWQPDVRNKVWVKRKEPLPPE